MALAVGTRFGAYEITGELGAGGMGEVYRATDKNLKRDVAIKVLPESFANDAGRLARFQREAEVLASLNHANIAQIYGLEQADGQTVIVMELVEGPTLADRIAKGPIPPDETLAIARQVADALEAAHAQQVVHRDLKPANIKLKADGTIKVLDFGIAKAMDAQAISGSRSPVMTTPAVTETGVILGTAAYMSPEQARGKLVDQRTDVWAFGCLLFEMLTGQPAFGGADVMLTLARVLDRDTDMSSMPGTISPAVRHTIRLCLEKDPKERIADIRDVRLALQGRFESELPRTSQSAARRPLWRGALPVAGAAIAAIVVTWLVSVGLRPTPPTPEVRRSIYTVPVDQPFNGSTGVPVIAVSPDGSRIAYTAGGALQLRPLDELEARTVPGTAGENPIVPVFSPDGEWILYGAGSGLKRVPVGGGTPIPVIPTSPQFGWRWDSDGMIRYVTGCRIEQVPAGGGTPEVLVDEPDGNCIEPTLLPGGNRLIYERRLPSGPVVAVRDLTTGEEKTLFPGKQPLYLQPGYLTYFDPTLGLMGRRFNLDTLESGGPVALVNGILAVAQAAQYRISANGTLVYIKGQSTASAAAVPLGIADDTGHIEELKAPHRDFRSPSVSPDGSQVAVQVGRNDDAQIFVYDLSQQSELRQLTFEGANQSPAWTHDGQWITYSSNRDGDGRWRIYRQRADGSGVAEALTDPAQGVTDTEPAWTPDGKRLAYTETGADGTDIWIVTPPDGMPERLVGGPGNQNDIAFSPNGEAIAYDINGVGGFEVLVEPFPPDGSKTRISEPGVPSAYPVWSRDGTRLSYQTVAGRAVTLDITIKGFATRNRHELSFAVPPDIGRLDSMPGGDRMLVTIPPNEIGGNQTGREIIIVENWIEEVKQRIPLE